LVERARGKGSLGLERRGAGRAPRRIRKPTPRPALFFSAPSARGEGGGGGRAASRNLLVGWLNCFDYGFFFDERVEKVRPRAARQESGAAGPLSECGKKRDCAFFHLTLARRNGNGKIFIRPRHGETLGRYTDFLNTWRGRVFLGRFVCKGGLCASQAMFTNAPASPLRRRKKIARRGTHPHARFSIQ